MPILLFFNKILRAITFPLTSKASDGLFVPIPTFPSINVSYGSFPNLNLPLSFLIVYVKVPPSLLLLLALFIK